MIRGCALAILLATTSQVSSTLAGDTSTENDAPFSWVDTTTLGLQRGFTVSKKIIETPEMDGDSASAQKTSIEDALLLALEADDALPATWLENAALGLQRGFEVTTTPVPIASNAAKRTIDVETKKSPTKEAAKTIPQAPIRGMAGAMTLGLQRGFAVQRNHVYLVDTDDAKASSQPPVVAPSDVELGPQQAFRVATTKTKEAAKKLPQAPVRGMAGGMTLGLQRGFTVQKKSMVLVDAEVAKEASLSPVVVPSDTELDLQRGFRVKTKKSPTTETARSLPDAGAMALGLQRGFTVQRRIVVPVDAEAAKESSWPVAEVAELGNQTASDVDKDLAIVV